MHNRAYSPRIKPPWCDVENLPPCSTEVKNYIYYKYIHVPPLYAFMTCTVTFKLVYLYFKHREINFY
jgi:hypothetical protein